MSDVYEVRLYNNQGILQHVFDGWSSLNVERRLSNFSTHVFSISSTDSRTSSFIKDCFIEVRRRNDVVDWYQEYIGFHRTGRYQLSSEGQLIFTSYGRSPEDLLRRRILAYFAPYLRSGAADDVMKLLVQENATILAINPPRMLYGAIPGMTVAPSQELGKYWEGERSKANLLDTLIEISEAADIDFKVDWIPPLTFLFSTFIGPSRPITFSPEFGNVADLDYTVSATEETNVAIITTVPPTVEETSAATNLNRAEAIFNPKADATPEEIHTQAQAELVKGSAKEAVQLSPLQTVASVYGRDYFLGDVVRVRVGDLIFNKKIVGVNLTESGDTHSLSFNFGEVIPTMDLVLRNIARRLKALETP